MHQVKRVHRGKPEALEKILYRLTGLAREEVALIIRMGGGYIGKHRCKQPTTPVKEGELVSAYWQTPLVMEPVAFDRAWLVTESDGLLVAHKPSGIPTQGRRDADYMAFYELLKGAVKGYVGLHHRLDQDTSGLMVYSRDRNLNKPLADLFSKRLVDKRYLAVAKGSWKGEPKQVIDASIGSRREGNLVRQQVMKSGKQARTEVTLLGQADGLALVACRPKTGRTHQIRVHLAHLGLPLWGDALYGEGEEHGFLLHCYRLAWPRLAGVKAGNYTCMVPEPWNARLPRSLWETLLDWWKEEAC